MRSSRSTCAARRAGPRNPAPFNAKSARLARPCIATCTSALSGRGFGVGLLPFVAAGSFVTFCSLAAAGALAADAGRSGEAGCSGETG